MQINIWHRGGKQGGRIPNASRRKTKRLNTQKHSQSKKNIIITGLYSSGGLQSPQQAMVQTLSSTIINCIRLGTAEAGDLCIHNFSSSHGTEFI